MTNNRPDEANTFPVLRRVFPDANSIFTTDYVDLPSALSTGVLVLDTNALLVPYSTGPQSLDQIRHTYEQFAGEGRLVVPGQVAREFARNRPRKLAELHHAVGVKRDIADPKSGGYPLLASSSSFEAVKRIEADLAVVLKKYRKAVGKLLAEIEGWTWNDPVSNMYSEVFTGSVIHEPTCDEAEVSRRWQECVDHKLPPGYKDAAKGEDGVGDLRVWLTILGVGAERKTHAVFVSGDAKPDWWHQSSLRPLYPRFELVDEYRRASGGGTFHIVQFSKFLEVSGAGPKVVAEVASSERTIAVNKNPPRRAYPAGFRAERAVYDWLISQFSDLVVVPSGGDDGFDFVLSDPHGAMTAIIVKVLGTVAYPFGDIIASVDRGLRQRTLLTDNAWIVLVVEDHERLHQLMHRVARLRGQLPDGVALLPALLRADGELDVHDIGGALPNWMGGGHDPR